MGRCCALPMRMAGSHLDTNQNGKEETAHVFLFLRHSFCEESGVGWAGLAHTRRALPASALVSVGAASAYSAPRCSGDGCGCPSRCCCRALEGGPGCLPLPPLLLIPCRLLSPLLQRRHRQLPPPGLHEVWPGLQGALLQPLECLCAGQHLAGGGVQQQLGVAHVPQAVLQGGRGCTLCMYAGWCMHVHNAVSGALPQQPNNTHSCAAIGIGAVRSSSSMHAPRMLTQRLPCMRREVAGTNTWPTVPSRSLRRSGIQCCSASWKAAAAIWAADTLPK